MALELKYNLNGHVDNPRVVGGSWRFRKSEIDQWTEANAVGPDNTGAQVERKP